MANPRTPNDRQDFPAEERPAEERHVHTRLTRLALAVEDSRAYWANLDPALPSGPPRAIQAFEQRWFGGKSLARVRLLLTYFGARYDTFPAALDVLRRWRTMDPATRHVICHWHLQLTDPIYRAFTGDFLVQRRRSTRSELNRDVVIRWMRTMYPDRWGSSTVIQFAKGLLAASSEAGLITPHHDPRKPLVPKVSDRALEYMLYLLRTVSFDGTLADNAYFVSVGLETPFLGQRLRTLPGVHYQRMMDIDDFEWKYPSLQAWAKETL